MEVDGELPEGISADAGLLALLEDLLAFYRAPVIEDFPPLYSG